MTILIEKEDVVRARDGYAWDVSKEQNIDHAMTRIRILTEKLGGLGVGDYVYVADRDHCLPLGAPSDRWSVLEDHSRLRIKKRTGGRVFVVRPDGGQGTWIDEASATYAI